MNVAILHNSVTAELDAIRPIVDPLFYRARDRARNGRRTNYKPFVHALDTALHPFRVAVKLGIDDTHDPRYYPVLGGWCYESDNHILLTIDRRTETSRFSFSEHLWNRFHFRFYKYLAHELTHRAQYVHGSHRTSSLVFRPHAAARANKEVEKQQLYLGEIDEIEAYARDTVEEWYYTYPRTPLTMAAIRNDFRTTQHLPTLEDYASTFNTDEKHPAVQRLFRKIKQWNALLTPLAESLGCWETSARTTTSAITHGFPQESSISESW